MVASGERAPLHVAAPCRRALTPDRRAGDCLERRPWAGSAGPGRIERDIGVLQAATEDNPYWVARRDRLVEGLRERLQAAEAKHAARLDERLREAVARHSGGDPGWLQRYVEGVLRAYAAQPAAWPYPAFEAAVLMGTRCPATGRLPGVRP